MTTAPRRPPPLTPKPGQVKVFRALYTYNAQYADELSFEEGDILYITEQSNKDWWKGRCHDKEGMIPTNYVEESAEAVDNPLHEAAKRGNIGFMKECIGNRVSVNGLDKAGSIPLHWASHGGHLECVQMLLNDPKCEMDVQNKLGDTPLHSAAWKGHSEVVKLLIEKSARVDVRNNEGKTPYDLARDPLTASLLQHVQRPVVAAEGYGDDDDSD